MLKEFKEFMMRGNVMDMAVGVVIGSAFTAIVTGVVEGVITPLINMIFMALFHMDQDKMEGGLNWTFGGAKFEFGKVITALITFVITAFVLFVIMKGINKLRAAGKGAEEEEEETLILTAEDYLKDIRDILETQTGIDPNAEKAATEDATSDPK